MAMVIAAAEATTCAGERRAGAGPWQPGASIALNVKKGMESVFPPDQRTAVGPKKRAKSALTPDQRAAVRPKKRVKSVLPRNQRAAVGLKKRSLEGGGAPLRGR